MLFDESCILMMFCESWMKIYQIRGLLDFFEKSHFFLVLNCTSLAKKVSVSFRISQLSISCAYWNSQTKLYWWINRDRSYKDFGQLLFFTITKRANEPFESVDSSFCCSKESLDKTLFHQYTFFMLQISEVYCSLSYQYSYFDKKNYLTIFGIS